MRDVNGWMVGALGAAALVAAFFLGGRVNGSPAVGATAPAAARSHGRRDGPGRDRIRLRTGAARADA